jgi:hypothetical protein
MAEDLAEQRRLAFALVGHLVRFLSDGDDVTPSRVIGCTFDGMVEITGYSGLFAPHLFRIVDES